MRTLYLSRHAKSSWDDPLHSDFHRPLNSRGERDAPIMARKFRDRGESVDLLVSSPAVRAITTCEHMAQSLGIPMEQVVLNQEIYLAPQPMLLRIVNLLPDHATRVMLFGHNPGFSELAEYLCDQDIEEMPTCSTVRIDLDVDQWSEVSMGLGRMIWYDHPKRYPELA